MCGGVGGVITFIIKGQDSSERTDLEVRGVHNVI